MVLLFAAPFTDDKAIPNDPTSPTHDRGHASTRPADVGKTAIFPKVAGLHHPTSPWRRDPAEHVGFQDDGVMAWNKTSVRHSAAPGCVFR
jgi:hypothetical protein